VLLSAKVPALSLSALGKPFSAAAYPECETSQLQLTVLSAFARADLSILLGVREWLKLQHATCVL